MGVIPPPPPPFRGSRDERREQMILYRDALIQMQGKQRAAISRTFWILLMVLSPWIISVLLKLWMGEWFLP